jgi:biofilm PGA synthesis N-glycosyltransferase PgaC
MVVIVPFLNEAQFLPTFLDSLASQTRAPDRLLLVDDGSSDNSYRIAAEFAARHPHASALRRPPRPARRDRLATAAELRAFQWALEQVERPWDVVAKLDADLRLPAETLAVIEQRLEADPKLGMAGSYLTEVGPDGVAARLKIRAEHVHGATKFYRRECYERIAPLPDIIGWDMIDEIRAQMQGWRTQSFAMPGGDPLHLRRRGDHGGMLRGFRRWGEGAYAMGEHPLHVVLLGVRRMDERPRVLGGLNYIVGWAGAAIRRFPRAEPELRAVVRRGQLARIRARVGRLLPGRSASAPRA